jgi:hypothetical protein
MMQVDIRRVHIGRYGCRPPARPSVGSAQQFADASVVGVTTIRRAERTASETKLTRVNDQAIRARGRRGGIHRCQWGGRTGGAITLTIRQLSKLWPVFF